MPEAMLRPVSTASSVRNVKCENSKQNKRCLQSSVSVQFRSLAQREYSLYILVPRITSVVKL